MKHSFFSYIRGVTSIEVVIGISIAGIVLIYSANAIMQFINSSRDVTIKTQAVYLAEEELEFVRFLRDKQWSNISGLTLDTPQYLVVVSGDVVATTTTEVIGEFTRSFSVQNVYRDSSTDDIVASTTSGSVPDTSSKYVTATISWGSPVTSVSLTTILTNITS